MTKSDTRPRLKERYLSELRPTLQQELGLGNVMQVPRLEKIVLNCGVGRATQQQSLLDGAVTDLTVITGQKPLVTRARKSIAGFKLREGNAIGAKVTSSRGAKPDAAGAAGLDEEELLERLKSEFDAEEVS